MLLTADTGAALLVYSDGRKFKQSVEGGETSRSKGRWQGYDFVLERKVSGGGKVTEEYLKSQDGKQLYVIVSVEGLQQFHGRGTLARSSSNQFNTTAIRGRGGRVGTLVSRNHSPSGVTS